MKLLNTFMGGQVFDRKQNIGIMLGGGDDDSFCDTFYMSSSKKQAIHDLLNIDIYLLIQVTTQCAFGSQVREAVSVGARGVIFYDPTGDYITNPIP